MAKQNLGKSNQSALPKYIKRMITTPNNFRLEVADMATPAALKTALQAGIKAAINSRIYLWPKFFKVEDVSSEEVVEETPIAMADIDDGQYRYKIHIKKDLFTHKAMRTHNAIDDGRVFILDSDNQLQFMLDEDGKGMGFSIAMIKALKMKRTDGTNATTSPVHLVLSDNEEWDVSGKLLDGTFGAVLSTLDPLTDVDITLAAGDAFAAAGFEVDVAQSSDGIPVSGLLLADFILYAADGITEQVIQTATEDANTPGRYNIVAPGGNLFEDGILTIRAASLITAAVGAYECPEPLTVNIP
jgi:hypothetical protein